jgi:hypothetical protein
MGEIGFMFTIYLNGEYFLTLIGLCITNLNTPIVLPPSDSIYNHIKNDTVIAEVQTFSLYSVVSTFSYAGIISLCCVVPTSLNVPGSMVIQWPS